MSNDYLIDKYIDDTAGPARAWVRGYGVDVWVLLAYLRIAEGDRERVAREFDVPVEVIEAALAYYVQHQEIIDARISLNSAA